jgi:hypothetical protein
MAMATIIPLAAVGVWGLIRRDDPLCLLGDQAIGLPADVRFIFVSHAFMERPSSTPALPVLFPWMGSP